MMGDWFILRTAGRSTLVLAKTLAEDGFIVWTPAKTQIIRVPRMNVKREITLPLLPSFVFARSSHLVELLELADMPVKPRRCSLPGQSRDRAAHRDFSVFHYLDQIPMISDRHLEPLRTKEAEAVPRKARPKFNGGDIVRVTKGAFEGLHGKVERCRDGYALVIFDDWKRPVKIPTFLLSDNRAFNEHRAAIAA